MTKVKHDPFFYENTAHAFCDEVLTDKDALTYGAVHWQHATYLYTGKRYAELSDKELNARVRQWLSGQAIAQNNVIVGNVSPSSKALSIKTSRPIPRCPSIVVKRHSQRGKCHRLQ